MPAVADSEFILDTFGAASGSHFDLHGVTHDHFMVKWDSLGRDGREALVVVRVTRQQQLDPVLVEVREQRPGLGVRLVGSAEARTESRVVPIGDRAGVVRKRLELGAQPLLLLAADRAGDRPEVGTESRCLMRSGSPPSG